MKKHQIIRLSVANNVKLFLANILNRFCCLCCWRKREKFLQLYRKSEEKVTTQLDVLKII